MKELVSCTADISSLPLGLSPSRGRSVEFSLPLLKLEVTLNIFSEKSLRAVMNMGAYLDDAFSPLSWLLLAVMCFLMFVGFFRLCRKQNQAFTVVFKTLLLRDCGTMRKEWSFLVLYMTASLTAMYTFACYSGMITSTMTLGKNSRTVKSS